MAELYPSLIAADLLNLAYIIEQLDPICDGYHIDIMDHHFVRNLTWGPNFANAISRATGKRIWVHLMVQHPDTLIEELELKPGSIVSFHFENNIDIKKICSRLIDKELQPSIAINPKTGVEKVFPVLTTMVAQVLIMSVEPGFSGQNFIPAVQQKIEPIRMWRENNHPTLRIGMDGGINQDNIVNLAQQGVDDFAIASALFAHPDYIARCKQLHALITS